MGVLWICALSVSKNFGVATFSELMGTRMLLK